MCDIPLVWASCLLYAFFTSASFTFLTRPTVQLPHLIEGDYRMKSWCALVHNSCPLTDTLVLANRVGQIRDLAANRVPCDNWRHMSSLAPIRITMLITTGTLILPCCQNSKCMRSKGRTAHFRKPLCFLSLSWESSWGNRERAVSLTFCINPLTAGVLDGVL